MEYKRGNNKILIFVIICIILFVIAGISTLYYLYQSDFFNKKESNVGIETIDVFIKPLDRLSNTPIDLNYMLFQEQRIDKCLDKNALKLYLDVDTRDQEFYKLYPNLYQKNIDDKGCYTESTIQQKVNEGTLLEGLNKFTMNKGGQYTIYYNSDNYYMNKKVFLSIIEQDVAYKRNDDGEGNLTLDENNQPIVVKNKTLYEIHAYQIAKELNISFLGNLEQETEKTLRLKLDSDYQYRDVHLCFEWSLGVTDLNGDFAEIDKPQQYRHADKCYDTGTTLYGLTNYTQQYDFKVKLGDIQENDYVKVYVFDQERFYDGKEFVYGFFDLEGNDIGAENIEKVKYLND